MKKYISIAIVALFLSAAVPASANWFQTVNGDVHTNGQLNSGTSTALPAPWFSAQHASYGESGIISSTDDTPEVQGGSETATARSADWMLENTVNNVVVSYNFSYFHDNLRNSGSPGGNPNSYCINPGLASGIYYFGDSQPVVLVCPGVGNIFNVGAGRWYVFLVDGNITVSDEVRVPQNSFLMFVSSGSITVSPVVPAGTPAQAAVQGVYIADRVFSIPQSGNNRIYLEGIFVAHNATNSFSLLRSVLNQTQPAETFTFRPAFLLTMPVALREIFGGSREVAP